MKRTVVVLGLISVLGITSCSQPSTEDAQARFCKDLAEFKQSVATLQGVSANSTVGALKDAQRQVEASFKQVKASAAKVDAAKFNDLETAYENLNRAVNDISDRATLKEAVASVQDEVQALNTAREEVNSITRCSP